MPGLGALPMQRPGAAIAPSGPPQPAHLHRLRCRRDTRLCPALWLSRRPQTGGIARASSVGAAPLIDGPEAEAQLEGFLIEHEVEGGRLAIRPLAEPDVGAASVVLTRSFAASLQGIPLNDGRGYVKDMLAQPPAGVLLIARLFSDDRALVREGQASRVVATACVSFCLDTREDFPSLQPPNEAAYLCNMAVDPAFRRRGYARRMLAACEQLSRERRFGEVFLHARLGDDPALQLYASAGYETKDEDSWLVKLRGITPRALMAKRVPPASPPPPCQGGG